VTGDLEVAGAGGARGYSWPPFEAGNTSAATHGAKSPRLVRARANRLLEEVTADRPVWLNDVDQAALWSWVYAEARCELLREWLDEHGHLDDKGKPRDAAQFLLSCERQAARARSALGFDPTSRAALGRDTAVARAMAAQSVEELRRAGAETRAGRMLRGLTGDVGGGSGDAA
jgi:hypothetical protein